MQTFKQGLASQMPWRAVRRQEGSDNCPPPPSIEQEAAGEGTSKCLACKHEDCSLIHRTHVKKLGVGVRACDPSTVGADMGGFLGLAGQPA